MNWIDHPEALAEALGATAGRPQVALDTEFHRQRTFRAELCLIQLALPEGVLLIDPLALPDLGPLAGLLADPGCSKLIHGAGEDLEVLRDVFGSPPSPVYDTQIAAAYAGFGAGVGLKSLLEQVLGVRLSKDATRTDWRQRPLTAEQSAYAVADVAHLDALHARLEQRLAQRGYQDWVREDCTRLVQRYARGEPDPQPHWQIRTRGPLTVAQQRRLRRLLLWREHRARARNRPREWVAKSALLLRLALKPPRDADGLHAVFAEFEQRPREVEELLACLAESHPSDADFRPAPPPLDPAQRQRYLGLVDRREHLAAELDLPPELLAPRRALEALARGEDWPAELNGWRRRVVVPRFEADAPIGAG